MRSYILYISKLPLLILFSVLMFLHLKQSLFLPFITKNNTPKGNDGDQRKKGKHVFIYNKTIGDRYLLSDNFHTTLLLTTHSPILLTKILESLRNYLTLAYSLVTKNSSEETSKLWTRNTNTFDVKKLND